MSLVFLLVSLPPITSKVHWFINRPELGKWMCWSPTERTMTVPFSPITSPLLSLSGCCLGWSRGQGVKERPAGLWEGDHEVSRPDKQWCARAWECRGVWEWYLGWESGQVCLCTLRLSGGQAMVTMALFEVCVPSFSVNTEDTCCILFTCVDQRGGRGIDSRLISTRRLQWMSSPL